MTETIKSVSVKIGADTSDFIKDLKKVDKEISTTTRTANELQKGLELEFDNSRFLQAQKQVQNAIEATENKAEEIRKRLQLLEDTGRIDTADYERLQLELAKTENNAVKLEERLEQLNKLKLDNLTAGIKNIGEGLENAGQKLTAVSVAAAAAIAGIGAIGVSSASSAKEVTKLAEAFDLTTDSVQYWQYVSSQLGIEIDDIADGMNSLRVILGEQLSGDVSATTEILDQLGISMSNFEGQEEAFNATLIALSEMEDLTLQATYAAKLFGEDMAKKIVPLLQLGANGLNEFSAEFEAFGALSQEEIESLSLLQDEFNALGVQFDIQKQKLGLALLPLMIEFVELLEQNVIPAIQRFSEWFGKLDVSTQKIIIGVLAFVAVLAPLLIIFGKVAQGVAVLIGLFAKLNATTLLAAARFAMLAGALVLGLDIIGNWGEMSTVEKILKSLALAALTAAAAITIFQASWSLGIAVGAIAAGIAAGIGAINAAKKDILGDEAGEDFSTDYSASGDYDFSVPDTTSYGGSTSNTYDNSTTNITIEMNATGDLDYDVNELATEVSKKLAIRVQTR